MIQDSNTQVNLYQKGLYINDEEMDLYLCNTPYNKYRHSVIKHKSTVKRKTVKVQCLDIKKVLSKHKDINAIKLDIEGAEMCILENVNFKKYKIDKLVFEWSFDFDPSLKRFKKMIRKLKKQFKVVYHIELLKSAKVWNRFPLAINVFCINN